MFREDLINLYQLHTGYRRQDYETDNEYIAWLIWEGFAEELEELTQWLINEVYQ